MRYSGLTAATLAALSLAACDVNVRSDDGNTSVRAGRNEATGRIEADINADGRGFRADLGNGSGGEVTVGNGTSVNYSNGDLRATVRTDENRSISVTTNRY